MGTVYSIDKENRNSNFLEEKINRFKRDISSVFNAKKISDRTFDNIMYKLNFISKHDALFFDVNMGKFLATFANDSESAIDYFEAAKNIDNTYISVYYQLYKCYTKVGNFHDALSNLYDCRDLVDEKEGEYDKDGNLKEDFTLPIKMLYALLDMEECFDEYCERDYSVPIHNKYCFCEIRNEEMLSFYHAVIEAFNERNYSGCLEILYEMNDKIKAIKYPMEIDTLIVILEKMNELDLKNKFESYQDGNVTDISDDEYMSVINSVWNSNDVSSYDILNLINNTIRIDVSKAKKIFELVESSIDKEEYHAEIGYLKAKINEYLCYRDLDFETKEKCNQMFIDSKLIYDSLDFTTSEKMYRDIKTISGLPCCDYFIAKTLFYQNKFEQAKDYFEKYLATGGDYYQMTLGFLANINIRAKKNGKAQQKIDKIARINDTFNEFSDYDYEVFLKKGNGIKVIESAIEQNVDSEKKNSSNKVFQKKSVE